MFKALAIRFFHAHNVIERMLQNLGEWKQQRASHPYKPKTLDPGLVCPGEIIDSWHPFFDTTERGLATGSRLLKYWLWRTGKMQ